jgi:hypothetical protein
VARAADSDSGDARFRAAWPSGMERGEAGQSGREKERRKRGREMGRLEMAEVDSFPFFSYLYYLSFILKMILNQFLNIFPHNKILLHLFQQTK